MFARPPTSLIVIFLAGSLATGTSSAEIYKFDPRQPEARNLGVWRLTHDPAVRDYGNYHNIQCWSPNGRYTCYTRFAREGSMVHVVDFATGADRFVAKGSWPRWANQHNWLFYVSDKIMRYDADTDEHHVISGSVSILGGVDSSDTWLYGTVEEGNRYITMRTRTEPGSQLHAIKQVPSQNGLVIPNPCYPVIMVRSGNNNRSFYDLDGSNVRPALNVEADGDAHTCWSGDGTFLLLGNRQVAGRYWNKPYPSDLEILSVAGSGDISPADKAGRYYCGIELSCMDTRSGDGWHVISTRSCALSPLEGDHSTATDIDPKGSPDGTKIHYHSNRDLENLRPAILAVSLEKDPDVIPVDSTAGFPDSGDLVFRTEVIGYTDKTDSSFLGIQRRKYGTRPGKRWGSKGSLFFPFSAYVLTGKDKERAQPDAKMLQEGYDTDFPMLYQRQTDCYIVVVRLPFRPVLRKRNGHVVLIPGEHHWETRGYRIFKDGKSLRERLFQAGERAKLPGPGRYAAVAVEWSGLESPTSLQINVRQSSELRVLEEVPSKFSWTREFWMEDNRAVSRARAMKAQEAVLEVRHGYDGLIASEQWRRGKRVLRIDFNEQGKPIRHQKFQDGQLKKRYFINEYDLLVSEEFYGEDRTKTEYIKYFSSPDYPEGIAIHWWFDRGQPVKYVKGGKVVFDLTGSE